MVLDAQRRASEIIQAAEDRERAAKALADRLVQEARDKARDIPDAVRASAVAAFDQVNADVATLNGEIAKRRDELEAVERAIADAMDRKAQAEQALERIRRQVS